MPLPILVGAAIGVGTIFVGGKKGRDAMKMFSQAREIGKYAEAQYIEARKNFNAHINTTKHLLSELGKQKLEIRKKTLAEFVSTYKRFQDVRVKDREINTEQIPHTLTDSELTKMEKASLQAAELLKGGVGAISTGYLATVGATSLATVAGTASTGTALGSLSGAAYTNALLAWFGGGAISAGGGGMAVGTAVLGGIAIGPVMAVGGFLLANQAEKALTNAVDYATNIDIQIRKLRVAKTALLGIHERVKEIALVLKHLNSHLQQLNYKISHIQCHTSTDLTEDDEKILYIAVEFAFVLNKVLDVPVIDADHGTASEQSKKVLQQALTLL